MNRTQILAAAFTLLAVSAPISEAAELVHSSAGSTYSDGTRSRGYWFTAPVTFTIDALRVPNVGGGGTQNLQIMTLPSAPPSWSSTSTNYTTLFYTNSGSSGATAWVPVNITIPAGTVVGILGTRGTGTMHNAYASTTPWNTDIAGNAITLRRFGTQVNIHSQQAGPVWTENSSYSRVEMDYSVGPVVEAGGPYTATEGVNVLLDGSATTNATSYTWDCENDGSVECSTVTCLCTYPEQGVYSALLSATGSLGSGTDTATVNVANAAPSAVTITGPNGGDEGSSLSFSGSAVDVAADTITYAWSFGDGTPNATTQSTSHTWVDNGTYTLTLTASDEDGGSTAVTTSVIIANVNPVIDSMTSNAPQDEGSPVTFASTISDVGSADTHTYAWVFGDGNTSTSANPSHTYGDDGTYAAVLTVTDNDGGNATSTLSIVIDNVAPTVAALSGPNAGDEGSVLSFVVAGSDPGTVDQANLTYSWDWGDTTSAGSGASPSHAWADEGTYTITVTVTDPQGATGSSTYSVVIANVSPTITTVPPGVAQEAVAYAYLAAATDPGADTLTWSLSPSSPAAMTVAPLTGIVDWTPTFTDVGSHPVTLTVDDGDGGQDIQTWTIVVGFIDTDGDGLADTWETDNGLDPTVDNSTGDPDGDGRDNLTEFLGGTDPNVWDGPTDPVPTSPIAGEEVSEARPTLTWDDATSPPGDPLIYDVELYEDAAATTLVTSATGLDPDGGGSSTWLVDTPLNENGTYYWQVRADDSYTTSAWSTLEPFFVNEVNEAPETPTPLFPVDGETSASDQPSPEWSDGVDVDQDDLGYRVRVWDEGGATMLTEGEVSIGARDVSWQVDIVLDEDTWYQWDVQAYDEHGLDSGWSEAEPFFVDTDNAAPGEVTWVNPQDGDSVESVSPELIATETTDPEAQELTYVFRLDTVGSFDSEDLVEFEAPHTGAGTVTVDLEDEGVELSDNTLWYGRVRAEDSLDLGGPWAEITFFVRGENDAPPVPELDLPADGSYVNEVAPTFSVLHVEDPDGDVVFYEIVVASDVEATAEITSTDGLLGGAGPVGDDTKTSWTSDTNLDGVVYWTARAVDDRGAASEWATPWMFTIGEEPTGDDDDDDTLNGGACDCESSMADAPSTAWALALLPLGLVQRRRR